MQALRKSTFGFEDVDVKLQDTSEKVSGHIYFKRAPAFLFSVLCVSLANICKRYTFGFARFSFIYQRKHPGGATDYEQYLKRPQKHTSSHNKTNDSECSNLLQQHPRLDNFFSATKNNVEQKKFDDLLQNLIVKSMLPLQFIEEDAFQQFVKGSGKFFFLPKLVSFYPYGCD